MEVFEHVILGGGVAAGHAAREFVKRGVKPGQLALVSAEASFCYERPPLSKALLAGTKRPEETLISPPRFYAENGIAFYHEWRAVGIDFGRRLMMNDQGETIGFRKLMLATGSRVRNLAIAGADLLGVHYLRTLEDARAIVGALRDVRRMVVIGGGFIGAEVAAQTARRGINTTLVAATDHLWPGHFTPEISAFFKGYFQSNGIHLIFSARPAALHGPEHVTRVTLETGQSLPAEMVVVGIGVVPELELYRQTGLQLDAGVLANQFLETNIPDVWAVGDICQYEDVLFGKRRRIEHWDNAKSQGEHAARAMLGRREPFIHVPYFFSDVFDLSWEFWGDTEEADRVLYRGDLGRGGISAWWLRGDQVHAAFVMNRPDEERRAAPMLIAHGTPINAECIANMEIPPARWTPAQNCETGPSLA